MTHILKQKKSNLHADQTSIMYLNLKYVFMQTIEKKFKSVETAHEQIKYQYQGNPIITYISYDY